MIITTLSKNLPISEQIYTSIESQIMTGILKEGDKLPSIREISEILLVNPNTVSKVYSLLENDEYIITKRGVGTFVATVPTTKKTEYINKHVINYKNELQTLKSLGYQKEKLIELLEKEWS